MHPTNSHLVPLLATTQECLVSACGVSRSCFRDGHWRGASEAISQQNGEPSFPPQRTNPQTGKKALPTLRRHGQRTARRRVRSQAQNARYGQEEGRLERLHDTAHETSAAIHSREGRPSSNQPLYQGEPRPSGEELSFIFPRVILDR